MSRWQIYEVVTDADGVDCYIKRGELVRCKECKYWRNTDAEKIPTASIACGNMHADDFCSYGVRETNTTAEEKPTPIRDYMVHGEREGE